MNRHPDFTALSAMTPGIGHSIGRTRRWVVRPLYLLLSLGVAMASADVIARIFLTEAPLATTVGLFALYGETAAIALGLALLRVLRDTYAGMPSPSSAAKRFGLLARRSERRSFFS